MGSYFDVSKNILQAAASLRNEGVDLNDGIITSFTKKLLTYDPTEGSATKGARIEGLLGVLLEAESQRSAILKEDPQGMNRIYREAAMWLNQLGGVTGYLDPENVPAPIIEGSNKKG